jgi:hypothetical protein
MNKNLVLNKDNTQKNTFFIHVKKSDFNNFDDLVYIKSLLDDEYNSSIDMSDITIMSKSELQNKKPKDVGKYMKSSKCLNCLECKNLIQPNVIYKKLDCGHRFHLECIENKLKSDLYKRCSVCNTEHVSNFA